MQKTGLKAITAILLLAMLSATLPLAFASTGGIYINVAAPGPSALNQQVNAGGNVSLNFAGVSFSGGQFVLYMSKDGFSQISVGDLQMNLALPFDVSALTNPVTTSPYTISSSLKWDIGNNWVNGTILSSIPGGNYFIKCFDGSTSSVAVTDTYFIVTPTFTRSPTSGGAGRLVALTGSAFGANSAVALNVTYGAVNNRLAIVSTNSIGSFTDGPYVTPAPDVMGNLPASTASAGTAVSGTATVITFTANETITGGVLQSVTFTENPRGLRAFGAAASNGVAQLVTGSDSSLYGNLTDFTVLGPVQVGVGSFVNVTGRNFYPGSATIAWDAVGSPATVTAGSTGSFTTLYPVPITGLGVHNITITDANNVQFVVFLTVTSSMILSPTTGPVGTVVTASGFGFPESTGGNVYNVTLTWNGYTNFVIKTSVFTDATGAFSTFFTVPHDFGGSHLITATVNASSSTAGATFIITPTLTVTPSALTNNGAIVNVYGSGFDPDESYTPNIDNRLLGVDPEYDDYPTSIYPNATGDIVVQFVAAGFSYGTHAFSLYKGGETILPSTQYVLFNVTLTAGDPTVDLLTSINSTVTANNVLLTVANATIFENNALLIANQALLTAINGTVQVSNNALLASINGTVVEILTQQGVLSTTLNAIDANVTSIMGTVATIQTSLGTLQTSVNAINATVISINGNVATISTSIGTLTTTVNAINATVTSISGTVATINTNVGILRTNVTTIMATLTTINNGIASVQTSVGTVQTSLASISSTLSSVSGTVGTISSSVGTLSTDLSAINTKVTSIDGKVATIQTDLGTLQGTVTSTDGKVATIQTNIGTLTADVSTLQTSVDDVPGQISIPIWVAVVLALIAALAAIASLLLVRRKIAG